VLLNVYLTKLMFS